MISRKYSCQNLHQLSEGNNEVYASDSNTDSLLGQIHVFLQLCETGLFGTKCVFLRLETYDFQEVILKKLTQFFRETMC
jgi:hypothetical protein